MDTASRLSEVRRVLRRALAIVDGEVREAFDDQIAQLQGASGPITMIELDVPPGSQRVTSPDGPYEGSPGSDRIAVVDDTGESVGGMIVWIKGGRLDTLEYYWYTDAPPHQLPTDEQIAGIH